jgi:hypothetical protein
MLLPDGPVGAVLAYALAATLHGAVTASGLLRSSSLFLHCLLRMQTWNTLPASLDSHDIHVAKVDCTQSETLCMRFDVNGYPSIKLVRLDCNSRPYPSGNSIAEAKRTHTKARALGRTSFASPRPVSYIRTLCF